MNKEMIDYFYFKVISSLLKHHKNHTIITIIIIDKIISNIKKNIN